MLHKTLILLMVIFPFIVIRAYSNESKRDQPQDSSNEFMLEKMYPEFFEALDKGIAYFENSKDLGNKSIGETFIPGKIMNNLLNDLNKSPVTEKNYFALKTLIFANRKISLAKCNNNVFDDKDSCFLGKKFERKYFEELLINAYKSLSNQKLKESILHYFLKREKTLNDIVDKRNKLKKTFNNSLIKGNLLKGIVLRKMKIVYHYHTKIRTSLLFLFCHETNTILKNILCDIVSTYYDLADVLEKEEPNCDLIDCIAESMARSFNSSDKEFFEELFRDPLQKKTKKSEELKKLPHIDSGSGLD